MSVHCYLHMYVQLSKIHKEVLDLVVVGSSHDWDRHICACHVEVKLPPVK